MCKWVGTSSSGTVLGDSWPGQSEIDMDILRLSPPLFSSSSSLRRGRASFLPPARPLTPPIDLDLVSPFLPSRSFPLSHLVDFVVAIGLGLSRLCFFPTPRETCDSLAVPVRVRGRTRSRCSCLEVRWGMGYMGWAAVGLGRQEVVMVQFCVGGHVQVWFGEGFEDRGYGRCHGRWHGRWHRRWHGS